LYFFPKTKFDVGHQIEFVLTLPEKISNSGAVDIRCSQSRSRRSGKNGTIGVAQIERYEFLPASATAA